MDLLCGSDRGPGSGAAAIHLYGKDKLSFGISFCAAHVKFRSADMGIGLSRKAPRQLPRLFRQPGAREIYRSAVVQLVPISADFYWTIDALFPIQSCRPVRCFYSFLLPGRETFHAIACASSGSPANFVSPSCKLKRARSIHGW